MIFYQYLPLRVYEVPAIRVNTSKSTYTFTSVVKMNKILIRGIYMSAHVLLNLLLNELRKKDKMRGRFSLINSIKQERSMNVT